MSSYTAAYTVDLLIDSSNSSTEYLPTGYISSFKLKNCLEPNVSLRLAICVHSPIAEAVIFAWYGRSNQEPSVDLLILV